MTTHDGVLPLIEDLTRGWLDRKQRAGQFGEDSESFDKPSQNPVTAAEVLATRRRVETDDARATGDQYRGWLALLLGAIDEGPDFVLGQHLDLASLT